METFNIFEKTNDSRELAYVIDVEKNDAWTTYTMKLAHDNKKRTPGETIMKATDLGGEALCLDKEIGGMIECMQFVELSIFFNFIRKYDTGLSEPYVIQEQTWATI